MKLNLIVTTDIHGYIYPTNYATLDNVADFGLARIATAIKEFRKNGPLLLIDNGDAFQGSPLLTYALKNQSIENPVSSIFNLLDYDLFNLGNHDFNYGPDILFNFINQTKAHLLTTNILYQNKPLGEVKIYEFNQKKIAFIGITTHYIPNWEQPSHILDFEFQDAYTHLNKKIQNLKNKVDLVIGVYHGGLEKDPLTGIATENLTGENQGYQMTSILGLDLLITGHQHRSLIETINNVLVTQSNFKGTEFILIEIDLKSLKINANQISAANYLPNLEIMELLNPLQKETQIWLDQPVGTIKKGDLLIKDEFEARLKKHPLISFLNQVQLEETKADISGVALFNGAIGLKQSITVRDLVSTYVYPNTLVVKKMSGAILKEMLEYSAYYFDLDENNNIKVTDSYAYPKPQHYNYDMFDGISYTIKISNPKGSRILDLKFKGQAVLDSDQFKVVINNYRASGGGDYEMVLKAKTIETGQKDMIEILSEYFLKYSPVLIKHQDNIKVIV